MNPLKGLFREAGIFISTFYRTTVIAPTLIADVLLLIGLGVVAPLGSGRVQDVFLYLFVTSMGLTLLQIAYFSITDPDRLAWQRQVLERHAIDVIYGDESHDLGRAAHIVAILNPDHPMSPDDHLQLPGGTKKQPDAGNEPPQLL